MSIPLPPSDLLLQVSSDGNPDNFRKSFEGIVQGAENYLGEAGKSLSDFPEILDFGCGVGKFLFGVRELIGDRPKLYGCDLEGNVVDWCKKNVAFAEVLQNQLAPPLPYSNERFDFIFALSVFTHLSPNLQYLWAWELHRVLKPGGIILFTTHGTSYFALYTWLVNNRDQARTEFYCFGTNALAMELNQPIRVDGYTSKSGLAAQGQLEVAVAQNSNFTDKVFSGWERLNFLPESTLGSGQDVNIFQKALVPKEISLPMRDTVFDFLRETFKSDQLRGGGVEFSIVFREQSRLVGYARLSDPGMHITELSAAVEIFQDGQLMLKSEQKITPGTRTYGNTNYYELAVNIPTVLRRGEITVKIRSALSGPQSTSTILWQLFRLE